MRRIILFGAPGSGKGTQADALEEKYGYTKISTGDLVRAEVAANTELGMQFKYIVDGFPRTLSQAEALSAIPVEEEIVVYLKVGNEDIVVDRILSRLTCIRCGAIFSSKENPPLREMKCTVCGSTAKPRHDDTEEVVRQRVRVYRKLTKPVIQYYKNKGELFEVDASRTIEKVFKAVEGVLN